MSDDSAGSATVDFCGELHTVKVGDEPLVVGRDGDVSIDDNPYLHRHFLQIDHRQGLWWLANVGTQLTATVSDEHGSVQAWLAPGAQLPLVFDKTAVWFTAGPTTYEFDILLDGAPFMPVVAEPQSDGHTTIGRMSFTPDQKILIIALCEDILRRGARGAGTVPSSADAAKRLGWTLTKFNRKLDNVCQKLTKGGIRGLHGGPEKLATSRRARLVEFALSTRLVTKEDLDLLSA